MELLYKRKDAIFAYVLISYGYLFQQEMKKKETHSLGCGAAARILG